ncbi:MAG: glycosyltransferase family 39 protein [Acidobacteria bacterium]|nr:glycosyltransferase family 39 protein [Acidobacteriota bacterium]
MKPLHAVLALLVLFAVMSAVSWQMWANPVIDGGREMNAPLRLLRGETIYSQVYYLYGPVAPLFNALLFKIFGIHLNTLYAAGLVSSLLLVLLIYHIARGFMSVFESLLAATAVLLLCIFKQAGNIVFPYSYAALYGTLFGTAALASQVDFLRSGRMAGLVAAGMLSGLAFCCKMEFGFAAFASLLTLVIVVLPPQRTRTAWISLASAAVIPLFIYGLILARIPSDSLIKDTFVFPGNLPPELVYYNKLKLGLNHPGQTLRELISAVALLGGVAGLLSLIGARLAGESILSSPLSRHVRRFWWLTGAGFGWIVVHLMVFRSHWDLNPLRALPVLFLVMILYCFRKRAGRGPVDATGSALLLVSVYSLIVLARVIVRIPGGGGYGAGLLPVPLMLFVYMATADFPLFAMPADAGRYRRRAVHVLLSIGLIATLGVMVYRFGQNSYTRLQTPRGNLRQPPSISLAMSQALEFLEKNSNPGDYVLALPEGSSLNFLADRPAPLRYEVVTPGFLSEAEEWLAIQAMQEKDVKFVFLLNRPTSEFGPRVIGRDYCRNLMEWIEAHYTLASVFGEEVTPEIQVGDPSFFIKCFRRE